jgi:pimeloyl-[acyl-carrier protein] synthase
MTAPTFWPLGPDGVEDPYAGYSAERGQDPFRLLPQIETWVATGHREVDAVLRDPRCSAARVPPAEELGGGDASRGRPLQRTLERMAALARPATHAQVRRPVQSAFAPAVIRSWRPRIRTLAGDLLDRSDGDPLEVVGEFADPLVDGVIEAMLCLPDGESSTLRAVWRHAAAAVDHRERGDNPEAPGLLVALHQRIAVHLQRLREQPGGTAPGHVLVRTAAEDPELTEADLTANLIFVFSSAHRAASQGLALAVHSLACHPDQFDRVRRDPALVPGAVEELLRFDAPVQLTSRTIEEDAEVAGHDLPAGQLAIVIMGAANRDPAVFEDGDKLDLTRPRAARHLSFGRGAHLCAGAALGRFILQEAIGELAQRAERLEIASPPAWTTIRRGFERLEVRL